MSSRGLGQFSAKNLVPGTFAVVVLGLGSWRYSFATDTAVQLLSSIDSNGTTPSGNRMTNVGNSVKAYLSVRSNSNGILFMKRMLWSAQKALKSVSLVPQVNNLSPTASGNSTVGVISNSSGASPSGAVDTITYSNDAVASGTTLTGQAYGGQSVATSDHALFALMGSSLQQTNKYGFADNSVVSGTNLTFTASYSAGASIGNANVGIFTRANSTNLTCKYTHAGDTAANSTNLVGNTSVVGGWNNDVSGVIPYGAATGQTNWTKWLFASDTVSAVLGSSTGLGSAIYAYGCANGIPGVSV